MMYYDNNKWDVCLRKSSLKIDDFDLSEIKEYLSKGKLVNLSFDSYLNELSEYRIIREKCSEGYNWSIQKDKDKDIFHFALAYYINPNSYDKLRGWNRESRYTAEELYNAEKSEKEIKEALNKMYEAVVNMLLECNFNKLPTGDYIKKEKYQFKKAKLSKNAETLSLETKEFGMYSVNTYTMNDGVEGFLGQLKNLVLNDPKEIDNLKTQIEKSLELDICIVCIDACRTETCITIYDSKGRRKTITGYMQFHGLKFFENFNTEYLRNKNFYTTCYRNGFMSLNIRKIFEGGLLKRKQGKYVLDGGSLHQLEINDFDSLKERYIELVGEEEAYSRLLLIEVQE